MSGVNMTVYKVTSDRDRNTQYEVKFYEDGTAECDCMAFRYQGRKCKHIDRLRSRGEGYKAPAVMPVYEVRYGDETVVLTADTVNRVVDVVERIAVNKTVTIRRLA